MTHLLPLLLAAGLANGLDGGRQEAGPAAEVRRPGPASLYNVPPAGELDAQAWLAAARHQVATEQMVDLVTGRPPIRWTKEWGWQKAASMMALAMLEAGCERWRVERLVETLRRLPPRIRPMTPLHVGDPPPPAETLARLERALGLAAR